MLVFKPWGGYSLYDLGNSMSGDGTALNKTRVFLVRDCGETVGVVWSCSSRLCLQKEMGWVLESKNWLSLILLNDLVEAISNLQWLPPVTTSLFYRQITWGQKRVNYKAVSRFMYEKGKTLTGQMLVALLHVKHGIKKFWLTVQSEQLQSVKKHLQIQDFDPQSLRNGKFQFLTDGLLTRYWHIKDVLWKYFKYCLIPSILCTPPPRPSEGWR